ncbi:hypothetical protein D1872_246970 [compost metagenome]
MLINHMIRTVQHIRPNRSGRGYNAWLRAIHLDALRIHNDFIFKGQSIVFHFDFLNCPLCLGFQCTAVIRHTWLAVATVFATAAAIHCPGCRGRIKIALNRCNIGRGCIGLRTQGDCFIR